MAAYEIELMGKLRRIKFDYNALADLEDTAGKSIGTLFTDESNIGFSTIRLLVWAGLRHDERGLTLQRTGLMIDQYMSDGGELSTLLQPFFAALKACKAFKSGGDEGDDESKNLEAEGE